MYGSLCAASPVPNHLVLRMVTRRAQRGAMWLGETSQKKCDAGLYLGTRAYIIGAFTLPCCFCCVMGVCLKKNVMYKNGVWAVGDSKADGGKASYGTSV